MAGRQGGPDPATCGLPGGGARPRETGSRRSRPGPCAPAHARDLPRPSRLAPRHPRLIGVSKAPGNRRWAIRPAAAGTRRTGVGDGSVHAASPDLIEALCPIGLRLGPGRRTMGDPGPWRPSVGKIVGGRGAVANPVARQAARGGPPRAMPPSPTRGRADARGREWFAARDQICPPPPWRHGCQRPPEAAPRCSIPRERGGGPRETSRPPPPRRGSTRRARRVRGAGPPVAAPAPPRPAPPRPPRAARSA